MSRRIFNKILLAAAALLCVSVSSGAQGAYGSFTPYSVFGIGDLVTPGTAFNKSMGGVGIATRNHRHINIINPAAVSARDTLAFMADFGLFSDNKIFRHGDIRSASNTFCINNLVMSFPIYKSSAMMVGIAPVSGMGYKYISYLKDPKIIADAGDVYHSTTGNGAIYEAFAAASVTFWNRLSIGAQLNFDFGALNRESRQTFSKSDYSGIYIGNTAQISCFSGKFGLQYEQPLGNKSKILVGATYRMAGSYKGYIESLELSSSTIATDTLSYRVDTLAHTPGMLKSAPELGFGVAFTMGDNFAAEFNYTRSDWRNTGIDNIPGFTTNKTTTATTSVFRTSISQAFRLGVEWTPNRNDIRYYMKNVSYRAGLYYKTDYYTVDNHEIYAMGLTLGATFPIYQWYNGITVGFELGQRGSVQNNLVRERYFNISVSFNIHDIWFRKYYYD